MNKLVDHLFVFEGNGKIKDFMVITAIIKTKTLIEKGLKINKTEKPKRKLTTKRIL